MQALITMRSIGASLQQNRTNNAGLNSAQQLDAATQAYSESILRKISDSVLFLLQDYEVEKNNPRIEKLMKTIRDSSERTVLNATVRGAIDELIKGKSPQDQALFYNELQTNLEKLLPWIINDILERQLKVRVTISPETQRRTLRNPREIQS